MSTYSFKTDEKFDKRIEDILGEIPKGSRSSFIKDALIHYIHQAEIGVVNSRYVQRVANVQFEAMQPQNLYSQPLPYNSYNSFENANGGKIVEPPEYVEEQDDIDDNICEETIEGNDDNMDIF